VVDHAHEEGFFLVGPHTFWPPDGDPMNGQHPRMRYLNGALRRCYK
jgi:hypothetical protein